MTDSQKLQNAARRTCTEQHCHWFRLYWRRSESSPENDAPQQRAVLARTLLLEAIQIEIERFDFEDLPALAELRELFVLAAHTATPTMRNEKQRLVREAESETRTDFARFIESFDADSAVEPLPYRRVLGGVELESVRRNLRERWGARGHFYPLDEAKISVAPTLFAYNTDEFDAAISEEKLAEILRTHGVNRVYEIREGGTRHYLEDIEMIDPFYDGLEVFISSAMWNWLFYASHESSVTTGGWLTKAIQDVWPNWERAKYNPTWRR